MSQGAATMRRRNGTLPLSSDTTETTETFSGLAFEILQQRRAVPGVLRRRGDGGQLQGGHVRPICRRLRIEIPPDWEGLRPRVRAAATGPVRAGEELLPNTTTKSIGADSN